MKTSEFVESIARKLFTKNASDNTSKNASRRRFGRLGKLAFAALIAGCLTGINPFDSGLVSSVEAQTWIDRTGTAPESLPTAGNYRYANQITVNDNIGVTFGAGVLAVYSGGLTSTPQGDGFTFATKGAGTLMVTGDETTLTGLANRRFRVENTLNLGGEYNYNGTAVAANAQFDDLANIGIDGGTVNYYAKDGTTVTYNGRITLGNTDNHNGTFNKTGTGTLVLIHAGEKESKTIWNAKNAFAGAYNINAGTLQLNDCFLPGYAKIASGATLLYNITGTNSYKNTGGLEGAGTLKKTGTGTLVVSGIGNVSGNVIIDAGVIELNNADGLIINSTLSGAGTLRKLGAGQLTINTNKSVAGNIDLKEGSVLANNGNITNFTSSVNVGTGTNLVFQVSKDSYQAFTGSVSGSGTISKEYIGTLVLRSSNTAGSGNNGSFTGNWNIAGTLQVGNKDFVGSLGGNVVLQLKNPDPQYKDYVSTLHFPTKPDTTLTYSGTISEVEGAGGVLKKTEAGTVVLSGGPNSYTGGTTIEAGKLILSNTATLGTGNVNIAGGALVLTDTASVGPGAVTIGDGAVLQSSATTTINGKIGGAGSLSVTGGTLTLSNENTYSGSTTIEAGTLLLTKSKSADSNKGYPAIKASSPISIYKDGTLEMNGQKITGNVSDSNNNYSVYGGEILNSSSEFHAGLRGVKLYGGEINGLTTGTAPNFGRFMLADTISAFAPTEVTVPSTGAEYTTNAVSALNADSISIGYKNGLVTFSVENGATLEINAGIIQVDTHSGDIKKTGKGTLVFSKENTYNRTTTITEGILKLTENGTLGKGQVTIVAEGNAAELVIARDGAVLANKFTGGGEGINKSGAIHFSENAEISGTIALSTHTGLGADAGKTGTISGKVSNGSENVFAKYGAGDIRLTGDLSGLDSTTIRADDGHLIFSSTAIETLGRSQVLSATANASANVYGGIGVDVASGQSYTLANKVTGTGNFAKYGDGELVYGNKGSDYQGGTYVYEGTLTLNSASLPSKLPLYVYEDASLKVTTTGAFGNGTTHPSAANLFGGTIDNNSTSHLTMTKVNMYGGTMESTNTSASAYGNFLMDDTISAFYTAPDGNVYNDGVSEIKADSIGFYYRNTSNKYVYVDDKATLVINSDIHKKTGQQYNTVDVVKQGDGLLVLNGKVDTKISITGGGLLLESGAVLNDTLTTATGTTVELGGTINAAATINGDWYISPEDVNDLRLNAPLTLAADSEILFPMEDLNKSWSYDIKLGTNGSINGLNDMDQIAGLITDRMTTDAAKFWTVGLDGTGGVVAYVDAGKVPEPSSLILLGLGLLGLYFYRRS